MDERPLGPWGLLFKVLLFNTNTLEGRVGKVGKEGIRYRNAPTPYPTPNNKKLQETPHEIPKSILRPIQVDAAQTFILPPID